MRFADVPCWLLTRTRVLLLNCRIPDHIYKWKEKMRTGSILKKCSAYLVPENGSRLWMFSHILSLPVLRPKSSTRILIQFGFNLVDKWIRVHESKIGVWRFKKGTRPESEVIKHPWSGSLPAFNDWGNKQHSNTVWDFFLIKISFMGRLDRIYLLNYSNYWNWWHWILKNLFSLGLLVADNCFPSNRENQCWANNLWKLYFIVICIYSIFLTRNGCSSCTI